MHVPGDAALSRFFVGEVTRSRPCCATGCATGLCHAVVQHGCYCYDDHSMNDLRARWLVVLGAGCLVACGGNGKKPDGASRSDGPAGDLADAGDTSDVSAGDASAADAVCTPACATNQTCVVGACQPTPVQMAILPGCGIAHLAALDGSLYWTEQATGAVKSLAEATPGGTPIVLASNELLPGVIAVDESGVSWSDDGDFSIVHSTVGGGARTKLLTASAAVSGLIARAGIIYYGAGASTYAVTPLSNATPDAATPDAAATEAGTDAATIDSAAADAATTDAATDAARPNATSLTLMTFPACHLSNTGALALDVDHLYQTDYLQQFLSRERIDGQQLATDPCPTDAAAAPKIAAPDTISHSQGELLQTALAVVGGQLIWADRSTLNVKVADGTAVSAQVLATTANANPITAFVVSGSSVYLGESGGTNDFGGDTIEVTPLALDDAGAPTATIIATQQRLTSQLVADGTAVYWVRTTPAAISGTPDDCEIMGLPK
jgi:hypothetical protein